MKRSGPNRIENAIDLQDGTGKLAREWFRGLQDEAIVDTNMLIIGIDEVGLGCVFGPLVVAGVFNVTGWHLPSIKDSKQIKSEATRNTLANEIRHNLVHAVAVVHVEGINKFGTETALRAGALQVRDALLKSALAAKTQRHVRVIFDGNDHPSVDTNTHSIRSIPKADATVFEVSAASILAKSTRDNWVHDFVKQNPEYAKYDLDQSKGYGTPRHIETILRYGTTPQHRTVACRTLLNTHQEKINAQQSVGSAPGQRGLFE